MRLLTISLLALMLVLARPAGAAATPEGTVNELHDVLLASMQAGAGESFAARSRRLAPVTRRAFDFQRIGAIVTGTHWQEFTPEQRRAFLDVFTKLVTANYADRFNAYNGERFEAGSAEDMRRGRKLVRTMLHKASGETVNLDYILGQAGGDWKILNIIADGVSDLALKRADYGAILDTEGLPALLERLQAQIDDMGKAGAMPTTP